MAQAKHTFNNAGLTAGYLIYVHGIGNEDLIPFLTDNTGKSVNINDLFWYGDLTQSDKSNIITIDLTGFGVIDGTWKLLLNYEGGSTVVSGRRAFELAEGTPTDDMRLIAGKELTPSINISFTSLYTLLLTKLGFLKVGSNLGDLTDAATARANIGTYSTAQMDAALNAKATLYQAGSGAALGVANTSIFTPTANYHPAVKKYVDESGGGRLASGNKVLGDIFTDPITVDIGSNVGTSSYIICIEMNIGSTTPNQNGTAAWVCLTKSATQFVVVFQDIWTTVQVGANFNWILFRL